MSAERQINPLTDIARRQEDSRRKTLLEFFSKDNIHMKTNLSREDILDIQELNAINNASKHFVGIDLRLDKVTAEREELLISINEGKEGFGRLDMIAVLKEAGFYDELENKRTLTDRLLGRNR